MIFSLRNSIKNRDSCRHASAVSATLNPLSEQPVGLTLQTAERLSRCEIITHRAFVPVISPRLTISISSCQINRTIPRSFRKILTY